MQFSLPIPPHSPWLGHAHLPPSWVLSCTINEIKKAKPISKLVKVVCLADNLLIITIWGALTYSPESSASYTPSSPSPSFYSSYSSSCSSRLSPLPTCGYFAATSTLLNFVFYKYLFLFAHRGYFDYVSECARRGTKHRTTIGKVGEAEKRRVRATDRE